ncbi:hypothetical protein M9Y10_035612 [Tritrichomonas musculus]|uniref:Uncharacterized protein n=1 Tax=Tritrichomonas musculus TaxID=1915356 RepID=A0ABR2GWA1_9EUKA
MTTETTPEFMQTFTLWANNLPYYLDGPTFAKMSKKCGKMMGEGKTQGTLVQRVRTDTITAFINACQLQPFKVTKNTAFELQDIASEWEVATLSKFVRDYIKSKDLTRPVAGNAIAEMLEHCKNKHYLETDVIACANCINTALDDDNFLKAPPELIFRSVLLALQKKVDSDEKGEVVNKDKLIEFVITLFNENAQAAAPLISLIDFQSLTPDQLDGIFQCPVIHEENVNFFLAWALSNLRSKAERDRVQSESRHTSEMSVMRELVQNAQTTAAEKMKEEHDAKYQELTERINTQAEELKLLEEETEELGDIIEKTLQEHNEKLEELEGLVDKMKNAADDYKEMASNLPKILKDEVTKEFEPIKEEFNNQLKENTELHNAELQKIKEDVEAKALDAHGKSDALAGDVVKRNKNLSSQNGRISELKASLSVKIINDKLRYCKHLRDKENKFAPFQKRSGFWGVSSKQARAADDHITEINKRLVELCPLDGFE